MRNYDEQNFFETSGSSFRLSSRPIVSSGTLASEEFSELPRSYGQSIVVAIARDPESLFVYWDIDWSQSFGGIVPPDRKVYLRIYGDDGFEMKRMAVEPLAQSCDVRVSEPRSSFWIDIGYFDYDQMWHSAAVSDVVSTPPDKIGTLAPGDFALVPFHITFQRLTELFRDMTNGSLTRSLARLQEKASSALGRSMLTRDEQEIFRAMKGSLAERIFAPRIELDPAEEMRLQKKLESILGFGATSPDGSFSESGRGEFSRRPDTPS